MNRGETWTDGQCLGFLREHYKCDRVGEYIETLVSGRENFERLKELLKPAVVDEGRYGSTMLFCQVPAKNYPKIAAIVEESEATDERKG